VDPPGCTAPTLVCTISRCCYNSPLRSLLVEFLTGEARTLIGGAAGAGCVEVPEGLVIDAPYWCTGERGLEKWRAEVVSEGKARLAGGEALLGDGDTVEPVVPKDDRE